MVFLVLFSWKWGRRWPTSSRWSFGAWRLRRRPSTDRYRQNPERCDQLLHPLTPTEEEASSLKLTWGLRTSSDDNMDHAWTPGFTGSDPFFCFYWEFIGKHKNWTVKIGLKYCSNQEICQGVSWQWLSWNEPYFHSAVLSVAAGACRCFKSDSRQILSSPWWVKWNISMLCGVWLFPPLTSSLERFYTKLLLEYWKCSVSCAHVWTENHISWLKVESNPLRLLSNQLKC